MKIARSVALTGALALALPSFAAASDPVATAFVVTSPEVAEGGTASFQIGVTAADGRVWPAATVAVTVTLIAADGTVVAASAPTAPPEDVAPGRTTFAFVDLAAPAHASGVFTARAAVIHDGAVVGSSDSAALAVGTTAAEAPAPGAAARYGGQLAGNEQFASRTVHSGVLDFTGTYGEGKSFESSLGLSSGGGRQQPIISVQTAGTAVQVGTFAPAVDPLVFSGATGSGLSVKRVWDANRALSLTTISGAHATANPFALEALSYTLPVRGGVLAATVGQERVDGDVAPEASSFMRAGTLAGLTFSRPPDARRFSYFVRYGIVAYDDAVSGGRRVDHAVEAQAGFGIKRSMWTLDVVRAGPYFPNVAAPGVTPDRETETLTGTIPFGVASLTVGVNGYHDALPGSPSQQRTHFWTETIGLSEPLRNGDTLSVNVSNASQHRFGETSIASGNDNTAVSYAAKRGVTTYSLSLGSANQRDSLGSLQHTMQNGLTVTRAFGPYLQLSAGANFTDNHAAAMSGTSLLQAFASTATWTRGALSVSTSVNRATPIPYLGTMPAPTTAINYGVSFKPSRARMSLSASMTQNYGATSASNGSLNLTRQM